MNSLVFSQQHLNPIPQHYEGDSSSELAHQCYMDWKDTNASGNVFDFLQIIQSVNHAAHWLQYDITEHSKLLSTLNVINDAIMQKRQFSTAGPHATSSIKVLNTKIDKLRTTLQTIKTTLRALKEERYRTPLIEKIYNSLLNCPNNTYNYDLNRAECHETNNLTALGTRAWALEKLTCAIFLAIDGEISAYFADMARLLETVAPKIARCVAKRERRRLRGEMEVVDMSRWVDRLVTAQGALARLVLEGEERLEENAGGMGQSERKKAVKRGKGEGKKAGEEDYLGRIVRYWSRWDLEGRAQKEFKGLWSVASGRKCVVWQR